MSGFITKTECEEKRDYIVETWGVEFYDACLNAVGETFLSLLIKHGKI